jgi:hypothetical protein
MAVCRISEADFLFLGLEFAGFHGAQKNRCERTISERFRTNYGIDPISCSQIYVDMQREDDGLKRPSVKCFLMALNWLNCYETEGKMTGPWALDDTTIRDIVFECAKKIAALAAEKASKMTDHFLSCPLIPLHPSLTNNFISLQIKLPAFDDRDEVFIISVDGAHCRISEPRIFPSAKWYSHKFHKAALTYELGTAIRQNKLVWINGPFPASQSDNKMFNKPGGLKEMIPDGKRAIGDGNYTNNFPKLSTRNICDTAEVYKLKSKALARHETFNGRIKSYNILDHRFRHGLQKHKDCFTAVCVLVQYDMDNGHPLFEV